MLLVTGCEVGSWVLVVAGLLARYPLRAPRLGGLLLAAVPLVGVLLLAATAAHLRSGAPATSAHGRVALYLGFTLAHGRRLVSWADVRFAHRFAAGPAPVPLHGRALALRCWGDVLRTTLAAALTAALLVGVQRWVDDPPRTGALEQFFPLLGAVCALELCRALGCTIRPGAAPRPAVPRTPAPGTPAVAGRER
ncbi:hypothetical protein [Kineococcus esterisolvens]|uniref:hypothetical protein n=1 Tax=unclassified Kineococcus TaxID=2621656 RepID=UPI003D7E0716